MGQPALLSHLNSATKSTHCVPNNSMMLNFIYWDNKVCKQDGFHWYISHLHPNHNEIWNETGENKIIFSTIVVLKDSTAALAQVISCSSGPQILQPVRSKFEIPPFHSINLLPHTVDKNFCPQTSHYLKNRHHNRQVSFNKTYCNYPFPPNTKEILS